MSVAGYRLLLSAALLVIAYPASAAVLTVTDIEGRSVEIRDASRIVAIGGAVTETLFALGEGRRIVAVDSTSQWPEAARQLPQVGYQRTLAAEGILALAPTLVIGTQQAGPPSVIHKLRAAGVPVLILSVGPDVDRALRSLETIAQVVGQSKQGAELAAGIRKRLAALARPDADTQARALFILSAGGGVPLAAGSDSNADTMIRLAGGTNVVTQYTGYRPLSAESILGLSPTAIIVPAHVLGELGGRERVLALPGLAETPAARARRLIVMDGSLLLGMGPRLAEAAEILSRELRAERLARP